MFVLRPADWQWLSGRGFEPEALGKCFSVGAECRLLAPDGIGEGAAHGGGHGDGADDEAEAEDGDDELDQEG